VVYREAQPARPGQAAEREDSLCLVKRTAWGLPTGRKVKLRTLLLLFQRTVTGLPFRVTAAAGSLAFSISLRNDWD